MKLSKYSEDASTIKDVSNREYYGNNDNIITLSFPDYTHVCLYKFLSGIIHAFHNGNTAMQFFVYYVG